MQVLILRSLPGGGKSTLISTLEKQYGYTAVICSADHFFYHGKEHTPENYQFDYNDLHLAHKICKSKFSEAINNVEPLIVVDNTNIRLREYKFYFLTAIENGYDVDIHTIKNCSMQQSYKNNVHKVPMEAIERMYNAFQDAPAEIDEHPVNEIKYDFHELRKVK